MNKKTNLLIFGKDSKWAQGYKEKGLYKMLKVEEINSIEKLESLQHSWDSALKRSPNNDVHLTWEWFYAWWKNFGTLKKKSSY